MNNNIEINIDSISAPEGWDQETFKTRLSRSVESIVKDQHFSKEDIIAQIQKDLSYE